MFPSQPNFLKKVFLLGIIFFSAMTGCHPSHRSPKSRNLSQRGVSHVVEKGQTLWNIARTYGVPVKQICQANELKSSHRIKEGQKIWIPGAKAKLSVPPTCVFREVKFFWPLQGPILRKFGQHGLQRMEGIDIQSSFGTPIAAAAAGEVIYAGKDLKGYDRVIIIQHEGGYSTIYANNIENLVEVHQKVNPEQIIAKIGQGTEGKEPYVHFEIRHHQQALDPISLLP